MTPARSTDGSARVSITNQPISPIDAAQRSVGRSRRSSGPAAARKSATFWPGDGRQVRQAGVPEALHHLRRLVAIVADDEAAGQGGTIGREVGRTPRDHVTDAVRGIGGAAAGPAVAQPVGLELAHDVLRRDAPQPVGIERDTIAGDPHLVTGLPRRGALGDGRGPGPRSRSARRRSSARSASRRAAPVDRPSQ